LIQLVAIKAMVWFSCSWYCGKIRKEI